MDKICCFLSLSRMRVWVVINEFLPNDLIEPVKKLVRRLAVLHTRDFRPVLLGTDLKNYFQYQQDQELYNVSAGDFQASRVWMRTSSGAHKDRTYLSSEKYGKISPL